MALDKIRLLILDVDGVLTDNKLIYDNQGNELKVFHAHDGLGIKLLLEQGIQVAIISARNSLAVNRRMTELGVEYVFQDAKDKLAVAKDLLTTLKLSFSECAFMGDDLADLTLLQQVEFAVAPLNAVQIIKENAHLITTKNGGDGAVRELCDLLLTHNAIRKKYDE